MSVKSTLLFVTFALSATAAIPSIASPPKPHKAPQGLVIVDDKDGKILKDDGRLDGRGCSVGTKAVFDPATGTFTKQPAVKCNF